MSDGLQPIACTEQCISVSGRVFGTDRRKRIDLKKPIRDLMGRNLRTVWYCMEMFLTPEQLKERIGELDTKNVRPVILYFVRKEDEMP